jgi:fumarylacetoacetase
MSLDETHDPSRRSWVASANVEGHAFPVQNLPFGRFRTRGSDWRLGVAIGDDILDLRAAIEAGLGLHPSLARDELNGFMGLGPEAHTSARKILSDALTAGSRHQAALRACLVAQAHAEMGLPCRINGYTDFLTSRQHTERHGRFKKLKDPLPPAFMSLPVAYHGRTSSIRPSGHDVIRPNGQYRDAQGQVVFGPVVAMDFELEVGAFVGMGNELGSPVPIDAARERLFGYCLLNDWSAKDIQWWEQVLGPFLGKNFMTSISPWIVTADAMAPFMAPAAAREPGDPPLLDYLHGERDQAEGQLDLRLEAWLVTPAMRDAGTIDGVCIARTHTRNLYWTFGQMLTHHASNGCPLLPGDLLGSGTVSGVEPESRACMTEITEAGTVLLELPGGERRSWLHDGDEVVLRARAQRDGFVGVGFGECRGRIAPARPWPTGRSAGAHAAAGSSSTDAA